MGTLSPRKGPGTGLLPNPWKQPGTRDQFGSSESPVSDSSTLYFLLQIYQFGSLESSVSDSPILLFRFRYASFPFQVCQFFVSGMPVFRFRYSSLDADDREFMIKRYTIGELQFSRALRYSTSGLLGSSATNADIGLFVCLSDAAQPT